MMSSIQLFEREQLEKLDKEALIDLLLQLQTQIVGLEGQLGTLTGTVQKLQDLIAKNSHNSSKPPSSDGLKKPKTKSLRPKGQRPVGGQPGHKGDTLKMVSIPDHVKTYPVLNCPHCQTDLTEETSRGYEKRQVFDIPPVKIEVTEHQAEIKQCPCCQQEVTAAFPTGVTQSTQYGPRLTAQASYLNIYHCLPLARTVELLSDFYGQVLSEATLLDVNARLAKALQPILAEVKEGLLASDVVHFDESGLRVAGQLHWLHVASTPELTFYHVHRKRGQEGMKAGEVLPNFTGQAVHDHYASYLQFPEAQHCFCNAHHLRELAFVTEQYQQAWASEVAQLLLDVKKEIETLPETMTSLPPDRLTHYETEYDKLMEQGLAANPPPENPPPKKKGRPKQSPPKNLLDRLIKHKRGVLAFMYDFNVPFDNNLAERDVRMIKVKQKVSGTFRTLDGASTFCILRAYISTVRKQGQRVIDALHDVLVGKPYVPLIPREG